MSNVTIVKGDLFSAPLGSIICHACNCQGVWGAGIAKQFAKRYSEAYSIYRALCSENGDSLLGSCQLIDADLYTIGCLFTSNGYGRLVSRERDILDNTHSAIGDLILLNEYNLEIHMCKINSGLFGVDWNLTQEILEYFPKQKFTVWEL